MALTKVTKSGITNNAIDADKIEDGTILDTDITPGTITNAKLAGSIANAKLANSSLTINGSSVSLGSSISAGALDWQAVITADGSTGTTGVAGRGYFIDTTSAAHTFTLPVSAAIGDTIALVDYAGTFATNKLTIARNGHNIQGVANNSQIGTNRASVTLVYVDATKGWVYQNESNVADLQEALFITATGGTITTSGDFKIHTFTGDGSFVVSCAGNPIGSNSVDYLVLAGGGGAGGDRGGGGGAGGHRTSFPSPGCNAGAFPIAAQTYPITVGGGGTGGTPDPHPAPPSFVTSGSNSIFSTITSAGGGAGGANDPLLSPSTQVALSGGSGGGSAYSGTGGSGNTPPVSPPQGNAGGNSAESPTSAAGGGGGASTVGSDGGPASSPSPGAQNGGPGGNGITNSITGTGVTRGGGGGGGGYFGPGGNAGPGGGGAGGEQPGDTPGTTGTSGSINLGGGGGGGPANNGVGGAGGKGIVIIRYKFQ